VDLQKNSEKESVPLYAWCLIFLPFLIWVVIDQNNWNSHLFLSLNHRFSTLPDLFWTTLSLFGNGWFCFAVLLPIVFFAPRIIFAALLSGILTGILSRISKSYFDTARPAGVIDQSSFHIIDSPLLHSAMPSGHTMTAFAIAFAVIFSAPKGTGKYSPLICLLAIGAGLSRIAVGAHWPSDVLIGASFGIFCGLVGATLILKIPASKFKTYSILTAVVVLISLVNIYILLNDKLDFSINQPVQYVTAIFLSIHFAIYFSLFMKYRRLMKNHV
jgi:membrane-associated phospholipid phosphatase